MTLKDAIRESCIFNTLTVFNSSSAIITDCFSFSDDKSSSDDPRAVIEQRYKNTQLNESVS
jgi:hypothetical protein